MAKIKKSIHPDDDLHYKKMGLNRDIVEKVSNPAVLELMYFGHACEDEKYKNSVK